MSFFRKIFGGGAAPRPASQAPNPAITDPSFWEKPVPVSPEHAMAFDPEDEEAIEEDYSFDEFAEYVGDEGDDGDDGDDSALDAETRAADGQDEEPDVLRTDSGSIIVVDEGKLEPFDAAFVKALRTPDLLSLSHLMRGYAAWLEINVPTLHATLNPPATQAQVDAFTQATGASLPEQVLDLYRCCNGGSAENGLFDFDFNDLDAMASEYASARERLTDPALAVLSDGADNLIVVALEGDRAGAVYDIQLDTGERHLLALSLRDFLRQYLLQLAFGNYTLEVSEGGALLSLGHDDQEFNELFEPGVVAGGDSAA